GEQRAGDGAGVEVFFRSHFDRGVDRGGERADVVAACVELERAVLHVHRAEVEVVDLVLARGTRLPVREVVHERRAGGKDFEVNARLDDVDAVDADAPAPQRDTA